MSRLAKFVIFCTGVVVVGLVAEWWVGSLAGSARTLVESELSAATDIALDVRSRDLALIGESLGLERSLPALGPVKAHGRLRGCVGAVGVEDLAVLVGEHAATWLELDGSIADLANLAGVHVSAQFGVADLRHLQIPGRRALPDVGPMQGGGVLSDRKGPLGVERLFVTGGRRGGFKVDFSGAISDLHNVDEITVDATFEAASLGTLGALVGVEWPETGPVSFEGHITGSDEKASMTGNMRFGESALIGTASAAFIAGTRPNIHARVASRHIDFEQVWPGRSPRSSKLIGVPELPLDRWWSGGDPLPVERLRAIDADIELLVDRVTIDENLKLQDLSLILKLDDGHLVIREVGAGSLGGSLRAELQVGAHMPEPVLTLGLEANDVDLDFWLTQLGSKTGSTGVLYASAALNSHGKSAAELRSNLGGAFSAVARDGSFASDYGQAFAMNVLRLSLPALLSPGAPAGTGFGCVVAEFGVDKGIAVAKALALESENVVVVGRGQIDLGAGVFDLGLGSVAERALVVYKKDPIRCRVQNAAVPPMA